MKRVLSIIAIVCFASICTAQTFGVRAGLNMGTINGPTQNIESYGYNTGFHFGISYSYNFNDVVSLRTELGYFQTGYKYDINGESFYIIRNLSDEVVYEIGNLELTLENTLGYFSIPVVANFKVSEKIHLNAGAYVNFMVNPTGGGQLRFASSSRPEDITFRQALDYNYKNNGYFGDENNSYGRKLSGRNPVVRVSEFDNEEATIARFGGAYYQYDFKDGNFFNNIDAGLTFGMDYFLTRGFFVGLSTDYSLTDITNNKMDYDRKALNDDNTFKFSDDNDRLLTFKVSIGFRF